MYKFLADEFISNCMRDVYDIMITNIPVIACGITKNDMQKMAENIVTNYLQYDMQNYLKDPAVNIAESPEDYAKCYNGMRAIIYYRIAHNILSYTSGFDSDEDYEIDDEWRENSDDKDRKKQFFIELSKKMSEKASKETGIEINPSAIIGKGFVIDHGMEVKIGLEIGSNEEYKTTVIGETCVIGENCTILNGVILGAKDINNGNNSRKRHPNIGNNVTIAASARIFGNVTVGDNVFISPYCIVTTDIPDNSKVLLVNQLQIVKGDEKNNSILIYGLIPSPEHRLTLYGQGLSEANLELADKEYNVCSEAEIQIESKSCNCILFRININTSIDIKEMVLKIYNNDSSAFYVNSKVLNDYLKNMEESYVS